jgi:D-glycero-D-manno-heptose 1,7-bisphosphate phosphatase
LANTNGIKVIEISNQPGVAKGKISMEVLYGIDKKIDFLLKEKGVKIDYKYICYHHPSGVVPALTLDCGCRKPKPGLLLQAAKDLNIDLKNSVFLGDRDWDVLAGKAAGCKTIIYLFKQDNSEKLNYALKSPADYKVWSLDEALKIIKNLLLN